MSRILIWVMILLCGIEGVKAEGETPKEPIQGGFAEIILGDLLKDPTIEKINYEVEEAEVTLSTSQLNHLRDSLEERIRGKEEPRFLYYYLLARVHCSFANLGEQFQDKEKVKRSLEEALVVCKEAIRYNRDFSDSHRLLSDIYGRLIPFKNLMIYGMLYGGRSKKEAELALRLNPKNPEAYLARGRGYFFTPVGFGGNKKKALEYFKEAVKVCPNYYMGYMWIGLWYSDRGREEEAKEAFKKVLELKPNSGWALYELKRLEE